ncbi:hypothetical protein [uncultured Aureimonas sp.]|uniref:hypothetical protein n=1 Tax=uncultured Aureimonas sp. TaxID=1604662 RepID=UPI0025D218FE|nr:hypothetical protein [uncultured Aureimonas sp.]
MFPHRIATGYILTIAGNAYIVMNRTPDGNFVLRSLDVPSRVELFSFEELLETYEEGMLRIEPPRQPAVPNDGPDALWLVVCQTSDRLLGNQMMGFSNASVKAVMPQLLDAQVRYLERIGKGPTKDHRPKLVLPNPYTLRERMLRYRMGASGRRAFPASSTVHPLDAFDPIVAKMTHESAANYLSPTRPTVKVLYRQLVERFKALPEYPDLRVPSLSTFLRVVRALPCDLVDAARHGAAKAASSCEEAA